METRLTDEIARFKAWAVDHEGSSGEWECDYEGWRALYAAVEATFAECASDLPDDATKDLLLYAIARDNECGALSKTLLNYPGLLRCLARHAPDWNARWQIAVILSEAKLPESPDLIRAFLTDEEEYVRRRSLMEFAKFCPDEAEALAISGMDEEFEYTRIAALHVLFRVNSDRLSYFLERHEDDPNEYVRKNVTDLKAKRAARSA
jgi:hypothetical protein